LMGDSIATNPFMLGYAYQKGLLPVSGESIIKAIEKHGVAVKSNTAAFLWGRRAAHDLAAVERAAARGEGLGGSFRLSESLDELIQRRVEDLTAYQSAAYARRYATMVDRVRQVESAKIPGRSQLAEAVARYYYKLLAYKDEYEVARLYTDGEYLQKLNAAFEGDFKLTFHMSPPFFARPDPETGVPRKRAFGPWMLKAFRLMAKLKRLRGTPLDIFGFSEDRKLDRRLIVEYERLVEELIANLDVRDYEAAVELASVPEAMRGYGHIKQRHVKHAKRREAELLDKFRNKSKPAPIRGEGVEHSVVIMAG